MQDQIKILAAHKSATAKLLAAERDLRQQHADRTRERQRTWAALGSQAEVVDSAERLIKAAADRWRADHGAAWVRALSGSREVRGVEHEREVRIAPRLPDLTAADLSLAALCGLAPDVVLASLTAMIHAQPSEHFGLPVAERDQRLAQLDAEIADLARQHETLVDAAREAGLDLAHLPAVAERRQAEAEDAERERLLTEARETAARDTASRPNAWAVR